MVERVRALVADTHLLPLAKAVGTVRKDEVGSAGMLRMATVTGLSAYVWRLSRFARSHEIDLIHTNSMKAHIYGGLVGRLIGVPVVWHLRDYVDPSYLPPIAVRGVRGAGRVFPSGVIGVSSSVLESLHVSAPVVGRVIHDGLSDHELRPRPPRIGPTAWHAPARVGMVGRISPWKGQHVFLDAAAKVVATGHDAHFLIVGAPLFGEEDYERELRRQAERLGIADRIEFPGFSTDIDAVMADLDVMVHASISADPFPNAVLEGLAAGLPVVASRGGGVVEMIEEGVTGRLAEMGSVDDLAIQVNAFLDDPVQARRMGDEAAARARRDFTGEGTARAVEAFYDEVLSRRGRRWRARDVVRRGR